MVKGSDTTAEVDPNLREVMYEGLRVKGFRVAIHIVHLPYIVRL